jgi:hypothetical protein
MDTYKKPVIYTENQNPPLYFTETESIPSKYTFKYVNLISETDTEKYIQY